MLAKIRIQVGTSMESGASVATAAALPSGACYEPQEGDVQFSNNLPITIDPESP